MTRNFITPIVFCAWLLAGNAAVVKAGTPFYLDQVELSSKVFDPQKGEKIKLRFSSPESAMAEVGIYNSLGQRVASPFVKKVKKGVLQSVAWNGKDTAGKQVSPGVYYYTISIKREGATQVYNPYPESHGRLLRVLEGGYDEEKKEIYFKLPQAAMARVRVNLNNGGPIVATPLDWTPLAAGSYRFPWDGKDASGLIDVKGRPALNIMIFTYSLADNSLIVAGKPLNADEPFQVMDREALAKQEFPLSLPPDRSIHALKDPRLNRVARIDVGFPNQKLKDGVPVLSDKAPVRVTIDPRDQWITEMSRYELMFYIDTVVVFEDESGFAPFTFNLQTKDLAPGEHILTVNLLTYDDHYAVISKKVIIEHESDTEI